MTLASKLVISAKAAWSKASDLSVKLSVMCKSPTHKQSQLVLALVGVGLLLGGMSDVAEAYARQANYNDDRIAESVDVILTYINGSFGALVMVAAGVAAILASAFGSYKAAMGLLVVAVGSFILRSLLDTWFNTTSLQSQ